VRSQRSRHASIILSHMLQHIFPAASVKTNEGRWVAQRLNDSGSYCLPHAQLLSSLCGLNFREPFSLPIALSVFLRYLFRYDGSMMPGVFLKYLHATSVLNIAHSLVSSPGLHNHCENSHKGSGGRARQFQGGLARLQDRVQVRQATLQLVEGGSELTRLSYGAQQLP
jgi:hypothetical protein